MRYVIYARKSSEDEDRQILSIEAQLVELKEFAAKEKLEIVASFQEAKTAKEPGRIKFAEMLSFLESGKADGILSWHPDRLARNSVDGGKIIHFVDREIIKSLKFPCFWFEPTPQGLFMLNIAFGQSKYFVDNLRENVKRGLRQKIRRGEWPGRPPVGYINNLATKKIEIDKSKAPKIRKFFELYSTGNYTLQSLANWCHENKLTGFWDKPFSISSSQRTLQNIFYLGLMKYRGEIFEGQHQPIISKKLFDKCREVLKDRGKPQKVKKHSFDFLGLMKCPCSAAITAEKKIKKSGRAYIYYRCTKKKGPCSEKHFLRQEELLKQIKSHLQKVSLSSQDTERVLAELEKDENLAKEQAKNTVQNLKLEILELDQKLDKLLDLYLSNKLSQDEYVLKKEKFLNQKVGIQEKISDFEQKGLSWLEPAREFILSLNKAEKLLSTENYSEMTSFLKNIGSNHILQNRQLIFKPVIPYDLVAERSEATSVDLTFSIWQRGLDEVRTHLMLLTGYSPFAIVRSW